MVIDHGYYKNEAVQQYLNEVLATKLAVEGFVNVDSTLNSVEGDSIKIYRYSGTGAAEEVTEGEGNTGYSDITGTDYSFTVKEVQDRCKITDEELQRNKFVAEKKLDVVAAHIVNKVRADIVDQWYASENCFPCAGAVPTMAEFIQAEGYLDLGVDDGVNGGAEQYRIFMNPADLRAYNVYLAGLNVLAQYDIINGKKYQTINGIPVEQSDLAVAGEPFLATNSAVRFLTAPSVSSESNRIANLRTTEYYARRTYVAGLEFDAKVVKLGKAITLTKAAGSADFTLKDMEGRTISDLKVIAGQKVEIVPAATASKVEFGSDEIDADDDGKYFATVGKATAAIKVTAAS